MRLYFKFQCNLTKNGCDMHFRILKIVVFGVLWRHHMTKKWKILCKHKSHILMHLSFKFQCNSTTNDWDMHFWILKNCHFSEAISAYLEAPYKKMDGNLRKALDVNCLLLEGKYVTTNRSLVRALNVKTSKMMKFSEKMAFFRPHSAPWWIFLT